LARFIIEITSAFLLARSVLGLLAGFPVSLHAVLSSQAWLFFVGLRFVFGCDTSGGDIQSVLFISFLLDRCCRHKGHSGREKHQSILQGMSSGA